MPQGSNAVRPDSPSRTDASPRVLVVDDSQDSADSLGALLEILGATVTVAYDGEAALRTLQGQSFEIGILDIGMPRMDGYEVARRIRERPDASDLFLVALTGWGQEQHRLASQAAGFDHHLVKPTDVGALAAVLQAAAAPRSPRESGQEGDDRDETV